MKRIMLLWVLALPSAALAGTINFNASSNINCWGSPFSFIVPGSVYTIEVFGDATETGQDTWALIDGSITVLNTKTNATVFQDALASGTGYTNFVFNGFGTLEPTKRIRSGSFQFGVGPDGDGQASVSVNVPEITALEGLLLGFIGLVSMVGRKLKLGSTSAHRARPSLASMSWLA